MPKIPKYVIVNDLEKKIYSYLQKISFCAIDGYNNFSAPNKIILKGGVLLQSFVKSENIIPEIINNADDNEDFNVGMNSPYNPPVE
jgi:hypothetical protein